LKHLKNQCKQIILKQLTCIYVAMYRNYSKNNVNDVLNHINKYTLNYSIFDEYDAVKKMNVHHKPKNNVVKQPIIKNTITNQTINDKIMVFNTNYHILKHLFNGGVDKQTKSTMLELFAKGDKEAKNSIEYDFQSYKVKFCELLLKRSSCVKELKLNPNKIYEKIVNKNYKNTYTNEYNFELDVFLSILKILDVNCIYLSHKCSYIMNSDVNNQYYIILNNSEHTRKTNKYINNYVNDVELFNSFTLIEVSGDEFNDATCKTLETTYVLRDLKKPIKSATGYKVGELQDIAIKLGLIINKSNGKPKTKQELYDECYNKIISSI
jgi:hypothetical protein